MEGFWLYSYVALWVLVIALAVLTLSLLRLVGQMHLRIGPAGAMAAATGPDVGDNLGTLLDTMRDDAVSVFRFPKARDTLFVFVAPDCQACQEVLRGLVPFARRHETELDTVVVSGTANPVHNRRFSENLRKGPIDFVASPDAAEGARIGATPFGVWVDGEGVIHAKGIVNHAEHLESLRNARISGFATLDEYFAKQDEDRDRTVAA